MTVPAKRRKSPVRSVLELVVTVAVAVGLALGIQALVVKPYRIPSGSMIPTLAIGQRILVNRLDTHPGLYDVVVFHPPAGADPQPAVCGNPGQGEDNANPNDPTAYPQPCDRGTPSPSPQTFVKRVVGLPGDHLRITNGHVWRNGVEEHGSYVRDCPVPGDCTFRRPITVPAGEYYMMGDNRGISDDSRFWGPVPQRWIIGVAFFTYWPPDRVGTL